ncbi:MAG: peptidyl-prolyl cis-trans isomerase B (cyclophilin B) [Gammaproteobacteria bacterium]|jgi:peptidyl-prolyl cis-trans isomerase B (cyclophilin B)
MIRALILYPLAKTMFRFVLLILASLCLALPSAQAQQVKLTTTMGDILIEVDAQHAPESSRNFLQYVREGFYAGTIFHRVIDGFMLQGGGYTETFEKKTTRDAINNEATNSLKNLRGTLAMARTGNPHSATSQFFFNVVDNGFLDHTAPSGRGWGYAVFAKVIDGMDVVDKIRNVPTGTYNRYQDVPTTPVVITSATVVGE